MNRAQAIDTATRWYQPVEPLPIQHGAILAIRVHERDYKSIVNQAKKPFAEGKREQNLRERILAELTSSPGLTAREIQNRMRGIKSSTRNALGRMLERGEVQLGKPIANGRNKPSKTYYVK